ncbi:TolC family protein [Kiloniella antarctica]|uniref:TolC family protein n=1 Tax=Kiloniella antarctica TaxID=1550907 RepID=A0ABW5BNG3_9PROT
MLYTRVPFLCLVGVTIAVVSTIGISFASDIKKTASDTIQKEFTEALDLETAVKFAQFNDPWLVGNEHSEDAILSSSVAAGSLSDPTISISMANLPTDSLNFDQEAMTQAKIGISQIFPAGDSLAIRKRQLQLQGSQFPHQRDNRKAEVRVIVGQLWLNTYKQQESIAIIRKNWALFEQLTDIAESSYSTALGNSRQQDLVRAQLELTRLEDRLTVLHQKQEMYQQQLSEWLNDYFHDEYSEDNRQRIQLNTIHFSLSRKLPDINLLNQEFYKSVEPVDTEILFKKLSTHPALKAVDQKIKTSNAGIKLAKQKYKPKWGVNAGYGFRADDPMGNDRADLFSIGMTFSVPLFTANRQDMEVQSAKSTASAVKTEKWQLLRKLMASFEASKAQFFRLNQRQTLYQTQLLPQMHEQAEASLTAYTNDDGDFAEVVRARIAEIDAEISALSIDVERQKSIIQLNYFFTISTSEASTSDLQLGDGK